MPIGDGTQVTTADSVQLSMDGNVFNLFTL